MHEFSTIQPVNANQDFIWGFSKEPGFLFQMLGGKISCAKLRDSTGFDVVPYQGIFKGNFDYTQFSTFMRKCGISLAVD